MPLHPAEKAPPPKVPSKSVRRVQGAVCIVLLAGCAQRQGNVSLIHLLVGPTQSPLFWSESFDDGDANRWHRVEVRGQTDYTVVTLDGRRCLKAHSHQNASILLTRLRFNPETYGQLSWEWRVDQLPAGEALDRKHGSDASARVYVYFNAPAMPWQRRNLDYVWSASLPVGTTLHSAYSMESKIIVLESGPEYRGHWRSETRNLVDDFHTCFGGRPPEVIAIGLMSDTDNTGSEALAYFDDVRVSRSR